MFRPSIQKTRILFLIALINIGLFYVVSNSVLTQKTTNHNEKISAAINMKESLYQLKKYGKDLDLVISSGRDPFNTHMVFGNSESSPLVTDLGKYEAKVTVLKPNFAALVINEFEKAGLQRGDTIAISMTGSMPGANIAVLMACESMGLEYISISSLGASTSGATDINLSWPKMEHILYNQKLIDHTSNKFAYGGAGDYLKKGEGYRKLYGGYNKRQTLDSLMQTIYPDKKLDSLFVLYGLNEDEIVKPTIKKSVTNRIDFYKNQCSQKDLSCYKAYINIGGNVASLGYKAHAKLSKKYYGFVEPELIQNILPASSDRPSVIVKFAESNISVINFIEIKKLIRKINANNNEWSIAYFNEDFQEDLDLEGNGKWDKESYKWTKNIDNRSEDYTDSNNNDKWDKGEPFIDKDGMIDIGKGNLYYTKEFNMLIVWIVFLISSSITIYIGFISYKQINRQMRDYNPDE